MHVATHSAPILPPPPVIRRAQPVLVHVVGYAERGGCERCCEVFIRHARRYDHLVIVLGEHGPMTAAWEQAGAGVAHLEMLAVGWREFRRRLLRVIAGLQFAGAIIWSGIRVPLVLEAFAAAQQPVVVHAGNPFAGVARVRWLLRAGWLLSRPAHVRVMACSEYVADTFRTAPFYRNLPVAACLNPVAIPAENPHGARPLARSDRVRVGMVARLDPIKDHERLLRAFALLRADWPQAELHLAGDGPLRAAIERAARALGLAAAVHLHGTVRDVDGFLAGLDLFAYCTTRHEGMGSAVAEAMARGVPVALSDLPMMREVGAAAAEYLPEDPAGAAAVMGRMLSDLPARQRQSQQGYERVRAIMAPEIVVGRYEEALGITR